MYFNCRQHEHYSAKFHYYLLFLMSSVFTQYERDMVVLFEANASQNLPKQKIKSGLLVISLLEIFKQASKQSKTKTHSNTFRVSYQLKENK